jgi:lipoprotein-releasing system ATP-binding protein
LLSLKQIKKKYPLPSGDGFLTVLKGIDLEVRAGESIAISGPSGSGKSTLLNIIGTLDKASSGSVILDEVDLNTLTEKEIARFRNQKIGFIFQQHYLLPQCTVLENVLLPALVTGMGDAAARAKDLLTRVGLNDRLAHHPAQLSGGENQRVAFVRALINRPQLVLADEPTGSLDHENAGILGDLLNGLNRDEKTTLITVTHSLNLAKKMSIIYQLADGLISKTP